jgi:starch phosphorylase
LPARRILLIKLAKNCCVLSRVWHPILRFDTRFVFLEDYGIGVARMLYRGVDVWLNNPVRPQEACGTSGMKAALNGGLNCSVLDGWWDEMYEPGVGWAIPSAEWLDAREERDQVEAAGLLRLLETESGPCILRQG